MVHPHLISAILTEPWAISEEAVLGLSRLVSNIFDPSIAFEAGSPTLPSIHAVAFPSAAKPAADGAGEVVGGSAVKQVQAITISGPLTKNDQYCGPAGMKSMGAWIQQADRDPAVDGILLVIDSPGGTVAGTEELGAIIKATQKPIIAFVDDMACSAAYWLASCADEIIANNSTAQVGSIGVLLSFMDVQPALEREGVVFHTITAPQSTEKTSMFDKIRAGNYDEYKNTVLAPLAEKFIATVQANRPALDPSQTTGAVFFAKDVTGSLVDSIGTFQHALNRVAELASEHSLTAYSLTAYSLQPKTLNTQIKTMNTPELKRLATAAGVESFESVDGSITLSADLAEALESALELNETAIGNMQLQIDQQASQLARVTELEAELATAQARVIELSQEAGAESAAVTTETDDDAQASPAGGFWSRFHNLKTK